MRPKRPENNPEKRHPCPQRNKASIHLFKATVPGFSSTHNESMLWALPVQTADWTLKYERSNFKETGRYQEAVDFCKRLVKASPYAKLISYGTSPQGRPMVALVMTRDRDFSPTQLRGSKKPLIFIQNGIHAGEIEGKDASLILAREMLVTGRDRPLLDGANFIIVPVYSVDAHERFTPYNRINQNGPKEMGWRASAQNYNLNRDWTKADAPEARAEIRLIHKYRPDFLFDNHTTDGADYPYVLTLGVPNSPILQPTMAAWQTRLYDRVKLKADADGFLTAPYMGLINPREPSQGVTVDDFSPRYSTGYWSIMNRPSMLVETHVLKPYRQRVEATLSAMRRTIQFCIEESASLKSMNLAADAAERATDYRVTLTTKRTNESRPFKFVGYPYTPYKSEVSGGMISKWDRTQILEEPSKIFDTYVADATAVAPAAYAIPPEWKDIIDRIQLHALKSWTTTADAKGRFSGWKLTDVSFPSGPNEGHFMPRYKAVPTDEERELPAGTVIVPTNQTGSTLLVHLLEPEAPDSFLRWGLFNNVFEVKEYYEEYAMEPIAAKMLKTDPALAAEYKAKLASDAKFAASPGARLRWFFERSPYRDERLSRYPVVRLTAEDLKRLK